MRYNEIHDRGTLRLRIPNTACTLRLRTDAQLAPCASSWRVVSSLVPAVPCTCPTLALPAPQRTRLARDRLSASDRSPKALWRVARAARAVCGAMGRAFMEASQTRSAWSVTVSTDMCVCRENCEPLS